MQTLFSNPALSDAEKLERIIAAFEALTKRVEALEEGTVVIDNPHEAEADDEWEPLK